MYTVERIADPAEFLAATREFRAANPALTNVAGTIVMGVLGGRAYDSYLYLTVRQGSHVVGMAVRTAPWNLNASPMPLEAARKLGESLIVLDPALSGINGPLDVVKQIYSTYRPGNAYRLGLADVVYVLGEYLPPRWAAGDARPATADDLELLAEWLHGFGTDAGVPVGGLEKFLPIRVAAGHFMLWQDEDGTPVAMGAHHDPVEVPSSRMARIGPIYTPAAFRGRGYGTAITASLIEKLAPTCNSIMLFADADNPASNSIYRQLGFATAGEIVETYLS